MPEDELFSSMTFEARKHIPMDGSDAIIDFQVFGPNPKEVDKIDVGLVACTKKVSNAHLDLLKEVGFTPGIVDADPIAITNAFGNANEFPEEGAIVLLDIGSVSSSLVVWGRKDQFFTRDIPIGGYANSENIQSFSENRERVDNADEMHRESSVPLNEKEYAMEVSKWIDSGASIVGGCCRTRPSHIKEIRKLIDSSFS